MKVMEDESVFRVGSTQEGFISAAETLAHNFGFLFF